MLSGSRRGHGGLSFHSTKVFRLKVSSCAALRLVTEALETDGSVVKILVFALSETLFLLQRWRISLEKYRCSYFVFLSLLAEIIPFFAYLLTHVFPCLQVYTLNHVVRKGRF
jgi:hypothetical protein